MKNAAVMVIVASLFTSSAFAVNLDIWAESNGSSTLGPVAPGSVVSFSVKGMLTSDTDNQGLALIGFTLELVDAADPSIQAVPLTQSNMQLPVAMENFADLPGIRAGINNPQGYEGTEISGKLEQIGGAQNTIMNTVDCTVDADCPGASNLCQANVCSASAPFPVGTVITGIGHTAVDFVTGTFTAPTGEGDYLLKISGVFANVISQPQPPGIEYWATEAAVIDPINNVTDLSFSVAAPCANVAVGFDDPQTGVVDARQPRDMETGTVLMGIDSVLVSGSGVGTGAACWSACESAIEGAALSVGDASDNLDGTYTVPLNRPITPGAVSRITYTASGDSAAYTSMPGDSNGDLAVNASDIPDMVACCMNGTCLPAQSPLYSCDIDHSQVVTSEDILRLVDLQNGAGAFREWGAVAGPTLGCP